MTGPELKQLIDETNELSKRLAEVHTQWIEGAITIQEVNMVLANYMSLVNALSAEFEMQSAGERR